MHTLSIPQDKLKALLDNPGRQVMGQIAGQTYRARIGIPDYRKKVAAYYEACLGVSLEAVCEQAAIPMEFDHFGLIVEFETPVELEMFDGGFVMDAGPRDLIAKFGGVIVRNVCLNADRVDNEHRAKFRHLNFHYDRGDHQERQYSLYTRDPRDPIQQPPRESSTLFIANIVAQLQKMKESGETEVGQPGVRPSYMIFEKESVVDLIDEIILEHRWDEPQGTGEISMLNNRTALHASYYRTAARVSYQIGVRYLD